MLVDSLSSPSPLWVIAFISVIYLALYVSRRPTYPSAGRGVVVQDPVALFLTRSTNITAVAFLPCECWIYRLYLSQ